jgi:hypothetical protein
MQLMRIGLVAVLACLPAAVATAQSARRPASGTQSLAVAEHALIEALMRRDRAAFRKLLAPDSVFFFPTMSEGPEAIINTWLPFLVDGGPTMAVVSDGVRVSGANTGSSNGSFTIQGQTDEGFETIPAGTLNISWRRVGGAWKVSALDGVGAGGIRLAPLGGVNNYSFGMSREQVSHVPDCKPYSKVARTGDLECRHYRFEGQPMNISFQFNAGGLSQVQLWFYDGDLERAAREATGHVIEYLVRTTGGAGIDGLTDDRVTPEAVMALLREPVPAGVARQVEISGHGLAPEIWFARVVRHQVGYHVLLFAKRR